MSEQINFAKKIKYSVIINAIVANEEGKILLIQRGWQEEHGAGTWSVPGGKLDFTGVVNESLQKTAIKETLEETGVVIENKMYLIANNTFQHDEDTLQAIAIVFLCYYKSGQARPTAEAVKVKWISSDEIENFKFHNINVKNYVLEGFKFLQSHRFGGK